MIFFFLDQHKAFDWLDSDGTSSQTINDISEHFCGFFGINSFWISKCFIFAKAKNGIGSVTSGKDQGSFEYVLKCVVIWGHTLYLRDNFYWYIFVLYLLNLLVLLIFFRECVFANHCECRTCKHFHFVCVSHCFIPISLLSLSLFLSLSTPLIKIDRWPPRAGVLLQEFYLLTNMLFLHHCFNMFALGGTLSLF